jgi:(p)ppGpp synthase/HD superfamily hydrolase
MAVSEEVSLVEKAKSLAKEKHEGLTDKYGNPYIEHLERVANRVREMEYDLVGEIELYVATAYLHDIIEDTACTTDDLLSWFPEEVVAAIFRLTRPKATTYAEYIDRIVSTDAAHLAKTVATGHTASKIARVVKLADLLDHIAGPTPCPPNLKKRYEKSLYRLISKGI